MEILESQKLGFSILPGLKGLKAKVAILQTPVCRFVMQIN